MPKATTSINDIEHHDLKSCAGGFVKLRRLNWSEMLERRTMTGQMNMVASAKSNSSQEMVASMSLANKKVTEFEFKNCIVEHNLEDDNGNLLDFRSPVAFVLLDPRIGDEIDRLINKMNQFEEDLGNSESGSEPVLS